jgi:hypothetical protein
MTKEPEEIIEAQLVALIAATVTTVDVLGALTPVQEGARKLSPDTYVAVFVDQAGQRYYGDDTVVPCDYAARVTVHAAFADDKTGTLFRDLCRAVRDVLESARKTHSTALAADGFECDAFQLDSTQTGPDTSADNGGMAKTYSATVTGRYTPPPPQSDEEEPTQEQETQGE